ncbi:hypothetical protein [Kitasatospora sp. NPDC057198]|uniref:hypothetical protein n=1 Tax=Kitasatospora sp. NPDC057198 TaxID=3346046 RepID=UPI0036389AAE
MIDHAKVTNRHIDVLTAGRRVAAAAPRRPVPAVLGAALLAPAVLGTWASDPAATRGGEVRNELRLSVSTNSSTDPAVRLRAGEPATRTYHLSNHAEYPLGGVLLNDPQLPGGQFSCGADRRIPSGGAIDCTTTFTVVPGPQSVQVTAVADAPDRLPQAHADAPAGYLGITAGIRLIRVGTPAGTGLSHRAAPRAVPPDGPEAPGSPGGHGGPEAPAGPPSGSPEPSGVRELPPSTAATVLAASARPQSRAVAAAGGTVELQYRLEAFGDVPVTAASITEGLPGLGAVNCEGPDGGHTLTPGQAVDCRATGTARPGRQTGTARADGLADDATVGPDGSRQAPRRVSAEADGAYDGLQPVPSSPEPAGSAATGSGSDTTAGPAPGAGAGAGSGTGTGLGLGAGAGTGTGAGQGPGGVTSTGTGPGAVGGGTPPGFSGDSVPPGLFPVSVPPGAGLAAAAPGQQPGSAEQVRPAAGAPAVAGQMLGPFLPGQAPALLPGGTAFARPASPFAAPGATGAATSLSGSPVAAAAANPGTANTANPGAAASGSAGPVRASGQGTSSAVGPQQVGPTTGGSPGAEGEGQYATEDWPPDEEGDSWEGTEVMMLLLAILLPVLCVLAAAFTVRNRQRR